MAMKVDSDPFPANASYVEPLEVLMVDFEKVGLKDPTEGIIRQFEKESATKAFEESEKKKFQNRKAQNSVGPHRNFRRSFVPRESTPNNQWVGVQNGKPVDKRPTTPLEDVDSNMITESFESGFPDDLEAICGIVSILPVEFAKQTLGQQEEEDFEDTEFDYGSGPSKASFVTWVEPKSNSAIFDPPNDFMKNHLKPLFMSGSFNGYFVNRMLVDGGATINLIPKSSLKKLGKTEEDLLIHSIVITDFNGKTSRSEGMIALDIDVDPSTKEEGMYPTYVRLNPEFGFVIKYEAEYEIAYEEVEE
ncbi:hypothetical protein SESBI_07980 [Sesbania bispinosa]|nr:hypothetical protein SESBI_07980 [Sesbania bispinosa]